MREKLAGLALCSTLAACAADLDLTPAEPSQKLQPVQSYARNRGHFTVATPEQGTRVTGALQVPLTGANGAVQTDPAGNPLRWTCGVTFVTPQHAITAGHCVDHLPRAQLFPVEQYEWRVTDNAKVIAATYVDGFFPDYTRSSLSSADGFITTRFERCHVVRRCGEPWGPDGCDYPADVALIRCDDRDTSAPFARVAKSEAESGAVDMYWYHELLDMPIEPPGPAPVINGPFWYATYQAWLQKQDRWEHYAWYPSKAENYHYFPQQIWPLRSLPWTEGDLLRPRSRTGSSNRNLLGEAGFESGASTALPAPWRSAGAAARVELRAQDAFEGNNIASLESVVGNGSIARDVRIDAGLSIDASAWVRGTGSQAGYLIVSDKLTGARLAETRFAPGLTWRRVSARFDSGPSARDVTLTLGIESSGSSAWLRIDEVSMRALMTSDDNVMWTDLYGCHGSSGSGVFQTVAGQLELLGPAAVADQALSYYDSTTQTWRSLLCMHPGEMRKGGRHLGYARNEFVRGLLQVARSDP